MELMTTQPLDWGGYTIADLEAMPDDDDGLRYELDDGCLVVSPPTPAAHTIAATELTVLLHSAFGAAYRVVVEASLLFDERNYREPDVLVVRRREVGTYFGAPDVLLAAEVMSPSSVRRDRLVKPAQYAAAGIPHFWRLEPADRLLVTYALDGELYRETGRFTDEVVIDAPVLLRFRLSQLLD